MNAEHRWSNRKDLEVDVNLYYPPLGQLCGKTKNISLEGMFIELDGINIPPQSRLEVIFTTEDLEGDAEHRLPAYVVHESDGGIGLMLQHVGYREFDALRYMLNAA
ncbi:MAG: PilZ domain-containing protein [Gammaproteobacteria bacterium]